MMMNLEVRHGKNKPVIRKALVELEDKPFKTFAAKRDEVGNKDELQIPRRHPVLRSGCRLQRPHPYPDSGA